MLHFPARMSKQIFVKSLLRHRMLQWCWVPMVLFEGVSSSVLRLAWCRS